jgi:hypothetical protein
MEHKFSRTIFHGGPRSRVDAVLYGIGDYIGRGSLILEDLGRVWEPASGFTASEMETAQRQRKLYSWVSGGNGSTATSARSLANGVFRTIPQAKLGSCGGTSSCPQQQRLPVNHTPKTGDTSLEF